MGSLRVLEAVVSHQDKVNGPSDKAGHLFAPDKKSVLSVTSGFSMQGRVRVPKVY